MLINGTSLGLLFQSDRYWLEIIMKPSPVLCARLRFTTKEVGKGFYRGNRTGSMGAHTEYGGYVIDWRKVRNYNMPDLTDFKVYIQLQVCRHIIDQPTAHSIRNERNGTQIQTHCPR